MTMDDLQEIKRMQDELFDKVNEAVTNYNALCTTVESLQTENLKLKKRLASLEEARYIVPVKQPDGSFKEYRVQRWTGPGPTPFENVESDNGG